jgi:hypothetical protein
MCKNPICGHNFQVVFRVSEPRSGSCPCVHRRLLYALEYKAHYTIVRTSSFWPKDFLKNDDKDSYQEYLQLLIVGMLVIWHQITYFTKLQRYNSVGISKSWTTNTKRQDRPGPRRLRNRPESKNLTKKVNLLIPRRLWYMITIILEYDSENMFHPQASLPNQVPSPICNQD